MEDNRKFWDRNAKRYDKLHVKGNGVLYGELERQIAKYLEKEDKVLELASGTGNLAVSLSPLVSSWVGVDYSENMVKEAEKHGIPNASFISGDAQNIDFPEESFDVVVIANALHVMPEPEKALEVSHKVLKKDGILIVPTFIYEGRIPKVKMLLLRLAGFVTFHKWDRDTYESFVERAGFKTIEKNIIQGKPLPECFIALKKEERILFRY